VFIRRLQVLAEQCQQSNVDGAVLTNRLLA